MLEPFIVLFLAGLLLGSFANVCIYRLPRDKSLSFPGSHCPGCGVFLRWSDNIPVISFLRLKGRCRSCHQRISVQYAVTELLMACAFAAGIYFLTAPSRIPLLIYLWLSFNWITITVIDYKHRIIPDQLSLSMVAFGWLIAAWNPLLGSAAIPRLAQSVGASLSAGLGMLLLAWLGEKLFKKEAMGGGDVKLLAGFGAVLGWSGAGAAIVIGSFIGALVGLTLMAVGKKKLGQTIPFGPFLNIGSLVGFLFPGWWRYFFPAF